jgi:hypothetical protein
MWNSALLYRADAREYSAPHSHPVSRECPDKGIAVKPAKTFVLVTILVLSSFGSALAQSAVSDGIANTQTEIDGLNRQISDERAKSSRLNIQLSALGGEFNPLKARHDALQQQYAVDAAAYNGNCAGRPVSYGNCPSWRAKMLAEQQQLGLAVANMEQRAQELARQGQQLSNELVLGNARVQKLTNYKSQLEAKLQQQKASLVQTAPVAPSTQTENTQKCEGTFCIPGNPKNPGIDTTAPPKTQTTYPSASAQGNAMGKDPANAGCIFDGRGGCAPGSPMSFTQTGAGRGTASLSPAVKEAMSKTPEGQKLLGEETALRAQFANAAAKADEIKAKRDSATDPAIRGQLGVDYANADKIKGDIGQTLFVKEIAVETAAKKFVLDKN